MQSAHRRSHIAAAPEIAARTTTDAKAGALGRPDMTQPSA